MWVPSSIFIIENVLHSVLFLFITLCGSHNFKYGRTYNRLDRQSVWNAVGTCILELQISSNI